jgi:ribosomal-protein-alanine N-acetyltransferase
MKIVVMSRLYLAGIRSAEGEPRLKQPQLETARCILRSADPGDLDALAVAVRSPLFPRRLPLAQMQTPERLAPWLERMSSRSNDGSAFLWSIDLKEAPRCIGQVSLSQKGDSTAWSIAFWLDPRHWGRGFAVETVSGVIEAAFQSLDVPELWAGVALWNHRSIATLKSLGFHFVADNATGYFVDGIAEPVHEFRLT